MKSVRKSVAVIGLAALAALTGCSSNKPEGYHKERPAVDEAELRNRVRHVELHGVDADAAALRDLWITEPVTDRVHDSPLGRRQQIVVPWTAAEAFGEHALILAPRAAVFPPPTTAYDGRRSFRVGKW